MKPVQRQMASSARSQAGTVDVEVQVEWLKWVVVGNHPGTHCTGERGDPLSLACAISRDGFETIPDDKKNLFEFLI